ncbi:hypothetical protein BDF20DRAFT_975548 [Mycotypha africana]|uniref:uncharacterized protein n=1 Tax=Mycotypha africana TaxID=64632 RepID=UPI0022FFE878|nr:uncharacterized protein BDF20DRAFT_975548 [Mycotypha africana]KAI8977256.1 hypothetical protein BDF20DRAFT_975548 [Mycotypha africana]
MQNLQEGFRDSFWLSSSSITNVSSHSVPSVNTESNIPNYIAGVTKLFHRLTSCISENKSIIEYVQCRMDTEKACAELFERRAQNNLKSQVDITTSDMNATLTGAFTMLCNEAKETAHAHRVCASLMEQDVLEPLSDFTNYFEEQLNIKKSEIEDKIHDFEHAAQAVLLLRSVYWSRCRALEIASPDFRPPLPIGFYEEEEDLDIVDHNDADIYSENDDFMQSDTFVSGRRRSSSVTSELNVDKGGVRLGKFTIVPYQAVAQSINRMQKLIEGTLQNTTAIHQKKYRGQRIFEYIRDYFASPPPVLQQHQENQNLSIDTEAFEICQHLISLKFLKAATLKDSGPFNLEKFYVIQQNVVDRYIRKTRVRRSVDQGIGVDVSNNDNDSETTTLAVPSSSPTNAATTDLISNIFSGKKGNTKKVSLSDSAAKAHSEMLEADKAYKKKIQTLETSRKKLEENLLAYFDDIEQLEKERVDSIKQAFTAMATALKGTVPMLQETYNSISLVQETLKSEQDIQYIVEQNKLGPYCPKPYIYENYYYGSAIDQIFGVPLEEVAQIYGTYVPPIISKGIKLIEEGLRPDEADITWSKLIPMEEMNRIIEQINNLAGSKLKKKLEEFDNLIILANIIRVYLLELPECLLTYDLYEPIKILYASQYHDDESRLLSISKLLATLPSPNYYTLKALSKHLNKTLKEMKTDKLLNHLISNFAHILMRPKVSTPVNVHDRHPKRIVRDLFTQYDILFTKNMNLVQKSNESRSAIVANDESYFAATFESAPSRFQQQPPETNTSTESTLKRTFFSMIRHNSSSALNTNYNRQNKSNNISSSVSTINSNAGPPIVPHSATSITLFEDPEFNEDDTLYTKQQNSNPLIHVTEFCKNDEDLNGQTVKFDKISNRQNKKEEDDDVSYKTNVSFMLNMEAQDDDAIEINTVNDDMVTASSSAAASPTTANTKEVIKTRSRSSTKDTLENIALDPFFED